MQPKNPGEDHNDRACNMYTHEKNLASGKFIKPDQKSTPKSNKSDLIVNTDPASSQFVVAYKNKSVYAENMKCSQLD